MDLRLHWLSGMVLRLLPLLAVQVRGQDNNATDLCEDPQWFLLEWLGKEIIMTPSPFALTEYEYSDGSTVLEPDSLVDCVSYTCQSQSSQTPNSYNILQTTYGVSDDYYKTCETNDITDTETIEYNTQEQWKVGCEGETVGCPGCDCQTQVFATVEYFTDSDSDSDDGESVADKRLVSVNTLLDFGTSGGFREVNGMSLTLPRYRRGSHLIGRVRLCADLWTEQQCVAIIQGCSYSYTDGSSTLWQSCVQYSEDFQNNNWRLVCDVDDSNQINNDNCITVDILLVTSNEARIGCYYPSNIPSSLINGTVDFPTPAPTTAPTSSSGKSGGGNGSGDSVAYILLGVAGGLLICGGMVYLVSRKMEWTGRNSGVDDRFTQLAEAPADN